MKKKVLILCLILALMVCGLILMGCNLDGDDDGGCPGQVTCFYNTNSGEYYWCGRDNCAVYTTDNGKCKCK